MKLDRINSFPTLRLIACALVFVKHGVFQCNFVFFTENHFHIGQLGVEIFFVLSGFLITRILLADKANGSPWHYFVARRSLRIFPAWLLLLVGMSLLLPWLERVRPEVWTGPVHWSYWTYTFNYASVIWPLEQFDGAKLDHLWTLCVEEHYYLIWPILVYALPRRQSRMVLLTAVPVIVLTSIYYVVHLPFPYRYWGLLITNVQCISLAIGSLMAYHEGWVRSPSARLTTAALLLAGIWLARQSTWFFSVQALWIDIILAAGIVLLFLTAVEPFTNTKWLSWMSNQRLDALGTMTYGLYLFHLPVFHWFEVYNHGPKQSIEALLVVFAISAVSFIVVERPFIALGKRFRASKRPMSEAALPEVSVPALVSN